jgi:hypothetical protein
MRDQMLNAHGDGVTYVSLPFPYGRAGPATV